MGRQNKILVILEARTDKLLKHSVAIIISFTKKLSSSTFNYNYWSWILLNIKTLTLHRNSGQRFVRESDAAILNWTYHLMFSNFKYLPKTDLILVNFFIFILQIKDGALPPKHYKNYNAAFTSPNRRHEITCKNVWKYLTLCIYFILFISLGYLYYYNNVPICRVHFVQ